MAQVARVLAAAAPARTGPKANTPSPTALPLGAVAWCLRSRMRTVNPSPLPTLPRGHARPGTPHVATSAEGEIAALYPRRAARYHPRPIDDVSRPAAGRG